MQLLFILGNHPELSLAEIKAVLQSKPLFNTQEFAVFDTNQDPEDLQELLGGTIKIAELLEEVTLTSESELAEDLLPHCQSHMSRDGKIIFGISVHGNQKHPKGMRIGLELKKQLKAEGQKVRYVTSKNDQLSAADLLKNKVLEHGFEFLIIPNGKKALLAKTLTYQPLEFWSNYDMSRPARDMRRGMLPPKLARVMLNLSSATTLGENNESAHILDPFCGTGTVLEQAGLCGIKNIIGSDIDEKAIEQTKKNFTYLNLKIEPKLYAVAAKNISAHIEKPVVTHVITEPLLGKPRQGNESMYAIRKEVEELEELYKESFAGIRRIMTPDSTLVVSIPRHYVGNEPVEDNLIEAIESSGFQKEEEHLYKHTDQYVGRNITKFKF